MSYKKTIFGNIPNDWVIKRVGEIFELRQGLQISKKKRVSELQNGYIPLLKITDLPSKKFSEFVTDIKENYIANREDIIYTRTGNVGLVYTDVEGCIHNNCFKILFDNNEFDKYYIYYYLNNERMKNLSNSIASGSVQKDLPHSTFNMVEIGFPKRQDQKSIANILSALDNKIETNNQINKKLEEMAKAIFKQWFVDFEFPCLPEGAGKPYEEKELLKVCDYKAVGGLPGPSKDKVFVYVLLCEDGSFYKGITSDLYKRFYEHATGIGADWTKSHKPVKVIHYDEFDSIEDARKREEELKAESGCTWLKCECENLQKIESGLPAPETKLRQAGEMVESEMGMIPEGWEVSKLEEIANITMGQSPKGSTYNEIGEGEVFYQGRTDFKNRFPQRRLYTTEPKRMAKEGDILMSVRAPVGDINIAIEECCIGRGLCSLSSRNGANSYLLYTMFMLKEKFNIFNGEGTVFGSINQKDLKGIKIIKPKDNIIKMFEDNIVRMDKQYLVLDKESRRLKSIRDALLPKLMSGEIRVPINTDDNN